MEVILGMHGPFAVGTRRVNVRTIGADDAWHDVSYVIVREATQEEWLAQARANGVSDARIAVSLARHAHYYAVLMD